MFGASASNIDRSLGSVFLTFFLVFFFSSVSAAGAVEKKESYMKQVMKSTVREILLGE